MSVIRTRDDLRAKALGFGMVDAASGDVDAMKGRPVVKNAMSHRVGANAMRELGIGDDQILAKYGYLPEPLDEKATRRPAA